jgi:glycosyltransferase involved in cell wall biosynthesis
MLKILLCHNYYQNPGGESLVFESEAQGLKQYGHEVIEYSRHNTDIAAMDKAQKAGLLISAYGLPRLRIDLAELVKREKPDVAIVQNVFPLLSPSVYSTLSHCGVPVIQAVYNYRFVCPSAELYTQGAICERCVHGNTLHAVVHRCYRDSYAQSAWYASIIGWHRLIDTFNKNIDCFMVPDEFLGKKLIQGGIRAEKIHTNPNPFFVQRVRPQAIHNGTILFVGRLVRQKGVLTLIDAMKRTASGSRLVIVGQGELNAMLRSEIDRFAGESKITLLPPCWGDEMDRLVAESAAVVIPSEWYDNLPLILCQANAAGKPVIASRIDGIPEYVREGENGFLFEPGRATQLADLIDRVLQMPPPDYLALSKKARSFAEAILDYPNHYQKLMVMIEKSKEAHAAR